MKMKQTICLKCDRCKSAIILNSPDQIGRNIGPYRILCETCYDFESSSANFY